MRYVTTVIAGGDMQTEYDIERKYSYHEGVSGLLKNHAVIREDMVRPTFNKKYIFDSENEKYVVKYSPEIGHVTLETMVYLFDFINKKPEIEVIIDITDVKSSIDRYEEVGYEKFQVGRFDPPIYDFILEKQDFGILQKRLSIATWRDYYTEENIILPGTEAFQQIKASLRKL